MAVYWQILGPSSVLGVKYQKAVSGWKGVCTRVCLLRLQQAESQREQRRVRRSWLWWSWKKQPRAFLLNAHVDPSARPVRLLKWSTRQFRHSCGIHFRKRVKVDTQKPPHYHVQWSALGKVFQKGFWSGLSNFSSSPLPACQVLKGKGSLLIGYWGPKGHMRCRTSCLFLFSHSWSQSRLLSISGLFLWMDVVGDGRVNIPSWTFPAGYCCSSFWLLGLFFTADLGKFE